MFCGAGVRYAGDNNPLGYVLEILDQSEQTTRGGARFRLKLKV